MRKIPINPMQEVIELCGGSQEACARRLQVTQQTISKWFKKGIVPPRRVPIVQKETGIPKHKLNPEIFSQEVA